MPLLPDLDPLFRRQVQGIARLHVECLVPLRYVAHGSIGAIFGRRMRGSTATSASLYENKDVSTKRLQAMSER